MGRTGGGAHVCSFALMLGGGRRVQHVSAPVRGKDGKSVYGKKDLGGSILRTGRVGWGERGRGTEFS